MQSPESTVQDPASSPSGSSLKAAIVPDFSGPSVPIGQLTERADWPQCAMGVFVNIHGFEGVVVDLISQSIKVVSADRITQRFNANRLKTLFAPPDRSRPAAQPVSSERPAAAASSRPAAAEPDFAPPARVYLSNPNFEAPVRAIRTYASQDDFPACAYGQHVDITGFAGVVVEIVRGSLKVQAADGTHRSYNAGTLKKLYGRA
jgi:hypothetical protein